MADRDFQDRFVEAFTQGIGFLSAKFYPVRKEVPSLGITDGSVFCIPSIYFNYFFLFIDQSLHMKHKWNKKHLFVSELCPMDLSVFPHLSEESPVVARQKL